LVAERGIGVSAGFSKFAERWPSTTQRSALGTPGVVRSGADSFSFGHAFQLFSSRLCPYCWRAFCGGRIHMRLARLDGRCRRIFLFVSVLAIRMSIPFVYMALNWASAASAASAWAGVAAASIGMRRPIAARIVLFMCPPGGLSRVTGRAGCGARASKAVKASSPIRAAEGISCISSIRSAVRKRDLSRVRTRPHDAHFMVCSPARITTAQSRRLLALVSASSRRICPIFSHLSGNASDSSASNRGAEVVPRDVAPISFSLRKRGTGLVRSPITVPSVIFQARVLGRDAVLAQGAFHVRPVRSLQLPGRQVDRHLDVARPWSCHTLICAPRSPAPIRRWR